MVSKWRNTEANFEGFTVNIGLNSTKSRNDLRFSRVNPETGNKIKQKYVDEGTGEEFSYGDWGKAFEIDEDNKVIFEDKETVKKLKKTALSKEPDVQKVIDREELDIAKLDGKAHHLTPEEETEKKYALMWHGLEATDKVILMKYAPSTSENLYALWSDDRGLWIQEMVYPKGFETAEFEVPDLSDSLQEKAEKLVEKIESNNQKDEIVNDQREKLEEAIEKKQMGEELDVEEEVEKSEEEDLEDELEAVI